MERKSRWRERWPQTVGEGLSELLDLVGILELEGVKVAGSSDLELDNAVLVGLNLDGCVIEQQTKQTRKKMMRTLSKREKRKKENGVKKRKAQRKGLGKYRASRWGKQTKRKGKGRKGRERKKTYNERPFCGQ